jgi:hypothetical protein
MKSTKTELIDFAKDLYLQVDENGKRIQTWVSISNVIQETFKKKIHYSTIAKWAVKYGWEKTFNQIKMVGIEKAKLSSQEKENKIVDAKSDIIARIYSYNEFRLNLSHMLWTAQKKGLKTITVKLSGEDTQIPVPKKDYALERSIEYSEAMLLKLHGNKPPEEDKELTVVFK